MLKKFIGIYFDTNPGLSGHYKKKFNEKRKALVTFLPLLRPNFIQNKRKNTLDPRIHF